MGQERELDRFTTHMDEKEKSIHIIMRSYVLPPESGDDFPLGKSLPVQVHAGTSVGKFLEDIFGGRKDYIGMVVVNGTIAKENVLLREGDRVDIHEILGGG